MTEIDILLARFIEEWNAGSRPVVETFLNQAADADRDDLAANISTFLAYAPTPRFDEQTIDGLLNAPAVEAASEAFASEASAWPTLLPRLRKQAGLSLRDVARRVLTTAGLADHGIDKTESRLGAMERGELDATSVSARIIEVLGRVLSVNSADLARAGRPSAAHAGGALYRRDADQEDLAVGLGLLADALTTAAPDAEWDEVDELFFGRS